MYRSLYYGVFIIILMMRYQHMSFSVMLVLVLVLKDSLRTKMQFLSWSLSLTMQSLSLSLSLVLKSLSFSLLLKSLSLSWSLSKSPWSCPCDCVQMEIAILHVALITKYFTTDKHFTYYLLSSSGVASIGPGRAKARPLIHQVKPGRARFSF